MLTHMNNLQQTLEAREVSLTGQMLLEAPLLNKGSAFPEDERRAFHLLGLLPYHVASEKEQLARTYENYCREDTDLGRYLSGMWYSRQRKMTPWKERMSWKRRPDLYRRLQIQSRDGEFSA